jgi:hypothetical protein
MSANDGLLPLLICGHLHNGKVVGKKKVCPLIGAPLYILDIKDVKTLRSLHERLEISI